MQVSVTVPKLGDTVLEATVTRWLKAVGDQVISGEPLVEIATDKIENELPAPVTGQLIEIVAEEDEVVPVGGVLAVIEDQQEAY